MSSRDPGHSATPAPDRGEGELAATQIAVADIGGTHARFAFATLEGGRVTSVSQPVTLNTRDFPSFEAAWEEFGRRSGSPPADELAIAFAGPVEGESLKLTNSPWLIRPSTMLQRLGVSRLQVVNDFGAIAYAVSELGDKSFLHLCGPRIPLPRGGVKTIIGPGTGLGVAQLLSAGEQSHVIATEAGHMNFAPLDEVDDRILAHLRRSFPRVSIERLVSGPGLANIYDALAAIEGHSVTPMDDKALWTAALEGSDSLAAAALDRFCLSFGAVAGDLALAHGANAVVIAGRLGWRLRDHLQRSGFHARFVDKGRFKQRMEGLPVKLITHPQPGLFGTAVAFAREHRMVRSGTRAR